MLTVIDRFTRWPQATPIPDTSTATVAHSLVRDWISVYGIPQVITSDRGPQFTSALWREICASLGVKIQRTTAYHPEANGLVERLHRSLKEALTARCDAPNWSHQLPWVLMGLRSAFRPDLNASPTAMVLGSPISLPGDFWFPATQPQPNAVVTDLQRKVANMLPCPTKLRDSHTFSTTTLDQATHVFIKRETKTPLTASYTGPFKIVDRRPSFYVLDIAGRHGSVAISRLKPAFLDLSLPIVPQVPRRGRPIKSSPPDL